jgi:hypothetical protein
MVRGIGEIGCGVACDFVLKVLRQFLTQVADN